MNRLGNSVHFYEKMGFRIEYEEDIALGPFWLQGYVMRKELRIAAWLPDF